jgi:putative sigma-54 modulation protein
MEKIMHINITARHFKLSEDIKSITEKEVLRLEKYYDGIIETDVILSWEKMDRLAEINIAVHGTILTAQDRSDSMKKAINGTVNKLERQLIRYKDKLHNFEHEKIVDKKLIEEDRELFEE